MLLLMFINIIFLTEATAIDMSVKECRLNTTQPYAMKEGIWGLKVLVEFRQLKAQTAV